MSLDAQNLRTYSFVLGIGNVLLFAHEKHRTFFTVDNIAIGGGLDPRIWVGRNPPPALVADWIPLGGALRFPDGVAGPIYLADAGNNPAQFAIISSENEDELATGFLAVSSARFSLGVITALTTNDGDLLTTNSGDGLFHTTGF